MSHKSNTANSPQKAEGSKSHLHHSKSHSKSGIAIGSHHSKSGVHHSSKSGVHHSKSDVHHKSVDVGGGGSGLKRSLSKSKSGDQLKRSNSQRSGKENASPLAHHSKSHSGSKSALAHAHSHRSKSQVKSSVFSAGKSKSFKSNIGPMHINTLGKLHELQKSVVKSRIEVGPAAKGGGGGGGKSGHEKSGVNNSPQRRERNDPRSMKRNDNVPVEASAAHTSAKKGGDDEDEETHLIKQPGSSGAYYDQALLPYNIYTGDVRTEFQTSVMNNIAGSLYDPNKFLKKPTTSMAHKSFLYRHIEPEKLIDFMVHHMKLYYNLKADPDPYSSSRQNMDNHLWDNLAFIIPMLCRDVIDAVQKEPMIITIDVDPDVIIFGDIHGNFNDIYFIYENFITNPQYAHTKFLFLGDYVDRGPKPVEVLCFLFALVLSNPKRFYLLRGNHEVLKINRKYGFQHMCLHLFLDTFVEKATLAELNYKSFNRAFCYMPVAAVIQGSASSSGSSSGSSSKSGTESSKSASGSKSGSDSKSGTSSKSGSSDSKSGSKSGSSSSIWSDPGGGVKRIFCCHGGVPSYRKEDKGSNRSKSKSGTELGSKSKSEVDGSVIWTVDALNAAVKKPASLEPSRHGPPGEYAFNEILWNDPIPARMRNPTEYPRKYYINRKRGGHCCYFTESGLKAFLDANSLSLVIRGHQYRHSMATGFHYDFEGHLLTVFSSSNYCGTEENATGYVHVKGPDCHVSPHTLRTVAEAEAYRQFNILKIVVDEKTHAVTDVAF